MRNAAECNPGAEKGARSTPPRVTLTRNQGEAALPEYKRQYKKNINGNTQHATYASRDEFSASLT